MGNHKKYKARDKTVQRMTREGLVQENLSSGEVQHIGKQTENISFQRDIPVSENYSAAARQENPVSKDNSIVKPHSRPTVDHASSAHSEAPVLTDASVKPVVSDNHADMSKESTKPTEDCEFLHPTDGFVPASVIPVYNPEPYQPAEQEKAVYEQPSTSEAPSWQSYNQHYGMDTGYSVEPIIYPQEIHSKEELKTALHAHSLAAAEQHHTRQKHKETFFTNHNDEAPDSGQFSSQENSYSPDKSPVSSVRFEQEHVSANPNTALESQVHSEHSHHSALQTEHKYAVADTKRDFRTEARPNRFHQNIVGKGSAITENSVHSSNSNGINPQKPTTLLTPALADISGSPASPVIDKKAIEASFSAIKDNGVELSHRQDSTVSVTSADRNLNLANAIQTEEPLTKPEKECLPCKGTDRQNLTAHPTSDPQSPIDAPSVQVLNKAVKSKKTSEKSQAAASDNSTDANSASNASDTQGENSKSEKKKRDAKKKKHKKLQETPEPAKAKSKLQFDETDVSGQPGMIGTVKKGAGKAVQQTAVTVSTFVHGKVHEAEHENSAVEGSHKAELLAEKGIHELKQFNQNRSNKKSSSGKPSKLQEAPAENTSKLQHGEPVPQKQQTEEKKGLLNRFYQKRQNKKRAAEAAKAAKQGRKSTEKSMETATTITEKAAIAIQHFVTDHKKTFYALLAILLFLLLLVSQLQSCSIMAAGTFSTVTSSSWPAEESEITAADLYYTKLEAQLQQKVDNIESTYSGYDEYNYNIGEIGHDPVVLISYLSAKYGSFTFNQVKSELDNLFALQYQLDVETDTEQRAVTRTIQVGESLGVVTTSAYCNCSVCCGEWAGGPTASGVYPTSNHTLAVDANNPFVPIGTEIIMNGTLYKVEDTGNFARYGVDFDVYHDDHASALVWGHRNYEAFLAGDSGGSIQMTTTTTVSICNVTLSSKSLQTIITSRMNSDQLNMFTVYQGFRGNRQFLGTPLAANWYGNVSSYYGYRIHPTSGNLQIHRGLDIAAPEGTEILAVHEGTVTTAAYDSSFGNYIVIEDDDGYKIKYAHCSAFVASVGQEVHTGDVIAKVGSTGNSTGSHLHIEFLYKNEYYNPYFYLGVGSGSLYGNGFGFTGDVDALDDARFATLIREAERYLGMAYVWGGSSPSTGFDCSGFVSYVFTNSGVYNMGRRTAQGIYDICTPVSPSDAQPGDIIFFKGTYDTSGVSHVGIYVGNGQMIHCGDPIQYTSINTAYWQSHFYAFGRVGQ